jgi:hypothetical protein
VLGHHILCQSTTSNVVDAKVVMIFLMILWRGFFGSILIARSSFFQRDEGLGNNVQFFCLYISSTPANKNFIYFSQRYGVFFAMESH